MANTLLLISRRPEDQAFAAEVAVQAGLSLQTVADPGAAIGMIQGEQASVIFADTSNLALYQALENAIQQSIGLFSDKINANAIHFLTSEPLENTQYLVQSPLFGHFVMRNYGDSPQAAARHYSRIVKATQSPRAFGLQTLLKDGSKIQLVKLTATNMKQSAVEAVKNYLLAAKFQSRMATVVANAVDELLMNAMFDAPVDELGRHTLNSTARTALFKLEGKNAVEMHVGYDGEYVALTAVDSFGSLDKNKLLKHISKIYTDEEYKVRTSVAGAGIGLATVFHSGGSFFFVSEAHVRTEVTVFFKRTENFRDFKDQFKFISTQFYF